MRFSQKMICVVLAVVLGCIPVLTVSAETLTLQQVAEQTEESVKAVTSEMVTSAITGLSSENSSLAIKKKVLVKYKESLVNSTVTRSMPSGSSTSDPVLGANLLPTTSVFQDIIGQGNLTDHEINALQQSSDVELIEEDGVVQKSADIIPGNVRQVNSYILHQKGYTGKGVKVALFDTGIDASNTDLRIAGGVSFVDGVTSYSDDNGHGTAMASVLASLMNNRGFVGAAPDVELYAVKVLDQDGKGYYSSIIQGIEWAIAHDIQVISMSFGGFQYSKILEDVISEAYRQGILIVAASGNDGASRIHYPARYSQVIAVGAVDNLGKVASFSNAGDELDLVAPGVSVQVTGKSNQLLRVDGTSAASALVAGVASQLLQARPDIELDELRAVLLKSAVPMPYTARTSYGWGRLQATNSLENLNSQLKLDEEGHSQVEFVGPDAGVNGTVAMSYKLYGDNQTITAGQTAEVRAGFNSPHASCRVTEENYSGSVYRTTNYSPVYGNGAYITYTSSPFYTPGNYKIRYHCPDTYTTAYDDVFAITVIPASTTGTGTGTGSGSGSGSGSGTSGTNSGSGSSTSSAITITSGTSKDGAITYAGEHKFYRFTASISGNHTMTSTGTTDVYGYLLNAYGSELASNDDSDGTRNFKIIYALTAGQVYYVKVRHYSTSSTGAFGIYVHAPAGDTQAPTAPANLRTTKESTTSIGLQWDASTDNIGVAGYEIYRNGSLFTSVYGTSYINTNLTSNTTYAYSIRAIDEAGNKSTYSNSISVKTGYVDSEPPSVPGNIQTSDITRNNISFTWDASTDNIGVTGYDIYRDNRLLASVTGTSYTHTGLTTNTSYTYTIKARDTSYNRSANSMAYTETTKPDWYKYTTLDQNGVSIDVYLSDIDAQESAVRVITKKSLESNYREFAMNGGIWTQSSSYAYNPISGSSGTDYGKVGMSFLKIIILNAIVERKKDELLASFYRTVVTFPSELTLEDIRMIGLGFDASVDDNLLFGINKYINNSTPPEGNYYFMRAKLFADAAFIAYFTVQTANSLGAAYTALTVAGASGALALATSPSGIGGVAFGTAALGELAVAGALTGVSVISGAMTVRSMRIMYSDKGKLQNTQGFKIRNTGAGISGRYEGVNGGHTLKKHVDPTDAELLERAMKEGRAVTKYTNKDIADQAIQANLKANANKIENWLKDARQGQSRDFDWTHNYDLGHGVKKNTTNFVYNIRTSSVVLIRDKSSELGFTILTSYPKL